MARFREFETSSGLKVFVGKDEGSNDELVREAKRNDVLLHTKAPGSPFVNAGENPSKKDLNEAAVFCAKYSQDWRDNKKDVVVNSFLKANMKKGLFMKAGTWKVGKNLDEIKVKKEYIKKFEESLSS